VLGLKVLHGIVPVEDDGSAHFVVPADRNIYLQVLDRDYLAVQTERTYVNYRPGETRSCIGCHEPAGSAPTTPMKTTVMAMQRPPSVPAPQPGDETACRTLHYPADVQPVLDKHCLKCHNAEKKSGGVNLSGTPTGLFSVSYESLLAKVATRHTPVLKEGLKESVGYLPSGTVFSGSSPLMAMLSRGNVRLPHKALAERVAKLAEKHKDVNLSRAERLKISTWLDANCQFYGSYWGQRHVKHRGKPGFRPNVSFEQAISTTPPVSFWKATESGSASRK